MCKDGEKDEKKERCEGVKEGRRQFECLQVAFPLTLIWVTFTSFNTAFPHDFIAKCAGKELWFL